jgi:hypothetical protein
MSANTARHFALRFREFASIDESAGIIRDVAVITTGPALGHGIDVDATTLAQVKACAETYRNGLKVKMTHDGDAGDIVGYLTNFRIVGDRLLADLNLLKSSPQRAYILELASTIPDTFGLSIAFSGPVEEVDNRRMARCIEIYSADLVSEPAANPTGLFDVGPLVKAGDDSALTSTPQTQPVKFTMNPEEIKKIIDEAMSQFGDRLSKLESALVPPALVEDKPEVEVEMSANLEAVADKAAQAAFKLFAEKFGAAPVQVSAEAQPPKQEPVKTFEVIVRDHPEYSKNKAAAITDCVSKHADKHAEYLGRVRSGGEVTLF